MWLLSPFFSCHFSTRKFSWGQPFCKICKGKKWRSAVGKLTSCRQISPPPSRKVLATPLPPTIDELSKALDSLPHGKVPGKDGIPAEINKYGNPTLFIYLQNLFCQCWEEGSLPQDKWDANIVTLFKNKGDCIDTARPYLKGICKGSYEKVATPCRKSLSRIPHDIIFRTVQEKSREQIQPLHIAFIDLTKEEHLQYFQCQAGLWSGVLEGLSLILTCSATVVLFKINCFLRSLMHRHYLSR